MTRGPEKFIPLDLENIIYLTPEKKIKKPQEVFFNKGDIVRIKIGPAIGKVGIVIVERNGNYEDNEVYYDDKSIGVRVAEESQEHSELGAVINKLTQRANSIRTVIRWFDDKNQLTLVQKAE